MFFIINDLFEFLENKFKGDIPNIIFFIIGIMIGILLFIIVFLIFTIIYKIKNKYYKKNIKPLAINEKYKDIINFNKNFYIKTYKNSFVKEKLSGIGKIMISMMESISSLYYPNSKDPIFELSIEQLIDFLSYFSVRLEDFIDSLLDNRLYLVNVMSKYSIKDKKISFVIELINKSKEKEKKENIIDKIKNKLGKVGKKVVFKYSENIINKEFLDIIDSLGEDINNLYSKRKLNFKSLNKKKNIDRKVGDYYE